MIVGCFGHEGTVSEKMKFSGYDFNSGSGVVAVTTHALQPSLINLTKSLRESTDEQSRQSLSEGVNEVL